MAKMTAWRHHRHMTALMATFGRVLKSRRMRNTYPDIQFYSRDAQSFDFPGSVLLHRTALLFLCKLTFGASIGLHALNLVAKSLSDFFAGTISEEVAYEQRLFREGWKLSQTGAKGEGNEDCDIHWPINPPTIYSKPFQYSKQCRYYLNMIIHGYGQTNGPWCVTEYSVSDDNGIALLSLGRIDWAE